MVKHSPQILTSEEKATTTTFKLSITLLFLQKGILLVKVPAFRFLSERSQHFCQVLLC